MASNKARFVGTVVYVGDTETLGKDPNKPFYKRTIVVTDSDPSDKRQNTVPFEYFGEKCKYLDGYKAGDVVTIEYYPNGRSWKDPKTIKMRFFASFSIAYIKKGADEAAPSTEDAAEAVSSEVDNDMPF